MTRVARVAATALAATVALTSCSSPSDIEARHQEEVSRYASDIDFAQRWDGHGVFGLPYEGIMWISIIGMICITGLLVALGAGIWHYRDARASERAKIETKRLEVEGEKVKRGRCMVCGSDPTVDKPARG